MAKIAKPPKAPKPPKPPSSLERQFIDHLDAYGITGWEREHKFHKVRRWRFDFYFFIDKLAVELQGGTWSGGRHTRGAGYESDCEKVSEAMLMGIRVLQFTAGQVRSGYAVRTVQRLVNQQ